MNIPDLVMLLAICIAFTFYIISFIIEEILKNKTERITKEIEKLQGISKDKPAYMINGQPVDEKEAVEHMADALDNTPDDADLFISFEFPDVSNYLKRYKIKKLVKSIAVKDVKVIVKFRSFFSTENISDIRVTVTGKKNGSALTVARDLSIKIKEILYPGRKSN